jgi:hypothetical protein
LEFTKNDNKIEGVFFTKGILNHWDEELALRTNSEISIGQIRGRNGWFIDFLCPPEKDQGTKVLYIGIDPDSQGHFLRLKTAVRCGFELLLHSGKQILGGTVIQKQEVKCPFKSAPYAKKMLHKISDDENRLMRLYKLLGFIQIGKDEVALVHPDSAGRIKSHFETDPNSEYPKKHEILNIGRHSIYETAEINKIKATIE